MTEHEYKVKVCLHRVVEMELAKEDIEPVVRGMLERNRDSLLIAITKYHLASKAMALYSKAFD